MAFHIQRSLLASLHCPYCGSGFDIRSNDPDPGHADRLRYGVLACACHEYPVLDGIPVIQQLEGLDRIVDLLRRDQSEGALLKALDVFRVRWAQRSRWHRISYQLNCRRLVTGKVPTFADAAHMVRKPRVFAEYLVHRFANPNLLAAIGPMMMLADLHRVAYPGTAESRPRVLDLACGAGHASFLIHLLYPRTELVAADQDFVSLYLAKRFLAPDATHICWDVEVPSPFPDRWFEGLFCLDAFHYFRSKKPVVRELKRISTDDSLWLFPHLHNKRGHNLVAGTPLHADGYRECFGFADGALLDEAAILHHLSQRGVMDLTANPGTSDLDAAQALTFVRSGRDMSHAYNGFPSLLCREPRLLRVNPIFRQRGSGDTLQLELAWPTRTMSEECRILRDVLPSSWQLTRAELRAVTDPRSAADIERAGALVSRFILVPLPDNYRPGTHSDEGRLART